MKRKRYAEEKIIAILKEHQAACFFAESGSPVRVGGCSDRVFLDRAGKLRETVMHGCVK